MRQESTGTQVRDGFVNREQRIGLTSILSRRERKKTPNAEHPTSNAESKSTSTERRGYKARAKISPLTSVLCPLSSDI